MESKSIRSVGSPFLLLNRKTVRVPAPLKAVCISILAAIPCALRAQCVTAPTTCTELVTVGARQLTILVYRSHALTGVAANPSVTRALIVVHGAERAAQYEFKSALAAAFLAGALDNTIIIAPRFKTNDGTACTDSVTANELNWECDVQRVDWRLGGVARDDSTTSSFDAMDAIVMGLAHSSQLPNLKSIVVAGHSAGGQFVTLYAMANQVHDRIGARLTYVASNASAYAYLDDQRPAPWPPVEGSVNTDTSRIAFKPFGGARECSTYDSWPFGLANRPSYARRLSDAQLSEQASRRPVTYLLSELDISRSPPSSFYGSCAAVAQGGTRLERGLAFATYMTRIKRAPGKVIIVEACGHDPRCVFTASVALRTLFPADN